LRCRRARSRSRGCRLSWEPWKGSQTLPRRGSGKQSWPTPHAIAGRHRRHPRTQIVGEPPSTVKSTAGSPASAKLLLQLVERGAAGTELLEGDLGERDLGGAGEVVHVARLGIDEKESGGDLALRAVALHLGGGRLAVAGVVVLGQLPQAHRAAVVQLHADRRA